MTEVLQVREWLQHAHRIARERGKELLFATNLCSASPDEVASIEKEFGPSGLFRLIFLAKTQEPSDFIHFFRLIQDNLRFLTLLRLKSTRTLVGDPVALVPDNMVLPSPSTGVDRFNHHVLRPALSRKLYNPGSKAGYLVYGLGGPRILVSHPFRGRGPAGSYDIFKNTLDVVTSLNVRGYYGSFLFLDNIPGLEYDVGGIPAWLAWFSMIAAHSDLVVFVKQHGGKFGPSQQGEIAYTPPKVLKKVVEIPADELKWAVDSDQDFRVWSFGEHGPLDNAEFDQALAARTEAVKWLESYVAEGFRRDRVIQVLEDGSMVEFPLEHSRYSAALP